MDDAIRLVITVLFIGLIVLSIVFFGIFGIAPLTKLGSVINKKPVSEVVIGEVATTTATTTNGEVPAPETPGEHKPSSLPTSSPVSGGSAPSSTNNPPQENQPVNQPSAEPPTPGIPEGSGKVKFYSQSSPITADEIPSNAIRIVVSGGKFTPAIIPVSAGSPFTLAITSGNDETHVFKFNNPAFASIGLGVGPHQTRIITLSISEAGSYGFHCDVPGHAPQGEAGRIVAQ